MKSPFLPQVRAVALASLLLSGLTFAGHVYAQATASALTDPAQNSAISPAPRDPNWVKRHESFVEIAKKGGIDVLFLGDSITDFWRYDKRPGKGDAHGGKEIWDKYFAPLHAENFGISGDRTQHVLWRLDHGEVDGLSPKALVLMIGTNNTGFETDKVTKRNTPEQAAQGVAAIVHELRQKLPKTKILLLAVFPRDNKPDGAGRQEVNAINAIISRLDDGKYVHYLDINAKFLEPDGTLTKEIMPDFLHPTPKGYQIWADAIQQPLAQLMK